MEHSEIAKIVISVLLLAFLIFLGTQVYAYRLKAGDAEAGYNAAEAQLQSAEKDQAKLASDLEYYSNPANLEKEIKARFNYHVPDEKTIILVPRSTSSIQ